MRLRNFQCHQPSVPLRIAGSEFLHQMMPFELQLASRDSEVAARSGATDLRGRKTVTAVDRLAVNDPQVLGNEADWERLLLKPKKLRVTDVSIRLSLEHGLGKKTFPPQGNEPAGVEVFRMQAPDSQCRYLSASQRELIA
jgi:hypothetical protein